MTTKFSATFSDQDSKLAKQIAKERMKESIASRREDNHGAIRSAKIDEVGAIGEVGFSRIFGISVEKIGLLNTFKGADVADSSIQIRCTTWTDGKLIVRNEDADEALFVLIISQGDKVFCPGCMKGSDAKKSEWLKAPVGRPPAYFVPQSKLYPPQVITVELQKLRLL